MDKKIEEIFNKYAEDTTVTNTGHKLKILFASKFGLVISEIEQLINSIKENCAKIKDELYLQAVGHEKGSRHLVQQSGRGMRDSYNLALADFAKAIRDGENRMKKKTIIESMSLQSPNLSDEKYSMSDLITAMKVKKYYNGMNLKDFVKEYEQYTNQEITQDIIDRFAFTGLNNIDLITSDFLWAYSIKNLYNIEAIRNKKEVKQ